MSSLGGVDANADKLAQRTDLPASLTGPYTITGWFKRTSNAGEGGPVCVWNGGSYNTILITTGGMARVGSNLGGVDVVSVPLDTWHFFALVQSGAARQLTAYVGPVGGSLTSATHTSVDDSDAVTEILVGGGPHWGQQIRGSITEFRAWTRALTAGEVGAEFASGRTPASTTDLIGRYPLETDAGKLTATVGANLVTTDSGTWSTDSSDPFPATGAELAAAVTGSGSVSGAITTAIPLAGALAGAGSVVGAFAASGAELAGPIAGASAISADLTTAITAAGALAGSATVSATLTGAAAALSAAVSGAGAAVGDLSTGVALVGSLTGTSTASAGLEAGAATLAGALTCSSSTAAELTSWISLAGSLAGATSTTSSLSTGIELAGALVGSSSASLIYAAPVSTTQALTVPAERRTLFVAGEGSTFTPDPERRTLYAHH